MSELEPVLELLLDPIRLAREQGSEDWLVG
jgi:hypothetical protein